jgi:hypothetical protein
MTIYDGYDDDVVICYDFCFFCLLKFGLIWLILLFVRGGVGVAKVFLAIKTFVLCVWSRE